MPFLIAADYNIPVRSFPAYKAFQELRCQEAFHLARHKTAKELPPTCRRSTRNDSFIIHEMLVPWVTDIWVGEPDIFPDHRPLFLQMTTPGKQTISKNWFMPASWGDLPLSREVLDACYLTSPKRFTASQQLITEPEINQAFENWTAGVEDAVQRCVTKQHQIDPIRFPRPTLGKKCYGRCRETRLIVQTAPRAPKYDPTEGYNPPNEATTCKHRQKTRQVRRLVSLSRHLQKSLRSSQSQSY